MTKHQALKTSPAAGKAAGTSDIHENQAQNAPVEDKTSKEDMEPVTDTSNTATLSPAVPADSESPAGDNPKDDDPESSDLPAVPIMPPLGITEQTVIVIAADGEAADLLLRAWNKAAAPADIRIVSPADTLAGTFESLIADDMLPAEFIFVPGICIPVGKMTLADLTLYRTRILEKGEKRDYTGLPMHLTKEHIIEALEAFAADPSPSDEILVHYYNIIAHQGEIPNTASLHFGNTVVYATKADLCTGRLVDALRLKKFICLNMDAFGTAKRYLEEYVKR